MAQKIIPCGGWYIDNETLTFDENKVLSVVDGGGGTTGVASFNGRTGAVVPQAGDYTAEQVGAVSLSGGTMTGDLILNGDPTNNLQAATKQYVDVLGDTVNDILDGTEALPYLHDDYTPPIATSSAAGVVKPGIGLEVSGDGTLSVTTSPTSGITQEQADDRYLQLSGGTMTGALNMGANKITTNTIPTETSDVTNKGYVDGVVHVVSDEVDGIIAGTTAITLPVATDTKIGGVKAGSGLEVTEDGTLNVNETSIDIPVATISTVGGVKVGSGLMVTSDGTLSNPSANTITSLPNDIYYDVQPLTRSATQNIATINAMTKQVDGGYLDSSNSGQFTFIGADQTNAGLMVASDKVKLDGIPSPTVEDNDKILTVSNGTYVLDSIGNASTSTRGVVLQAVGVTDATNADDIITQFNALLASLRTSGVLQDNT